MIRATMIGMTTSPPLPEGSLPAADGEGATVGATEVTALAAAVVAAEALGCVDAMADGEGDAPAATVKGTTGWRRRSPSSAMLTQRTSYPPGGSGVVNVNVIVMAFASTVAEATVAPLASTRSALLPDARCSENVRTMGPV
jgi:hypothetical protein